MILVKWSTTQSGTRAWTRRHLFDRKQIEQYNWPLLPDHSLHLHRMLLFQTDSVPTIQHSLKFLLLTIPVLKFTYILHRSFFTNLLLACWTSMLQSSHVNVWQSLSISNFHFMYLTFLFFASGADASPELDAQSLHHNNCAQTCNTHTWNSAAVVGRV